ncbi:response regulator [Frigoriglobus tundricola]|uniref:response regulator n=1 Tax=Frigoriglobus tundricola TaxID=2774151 RepID=UPI00148ECF56
MSFDPTVPPAVPGRPGGPHPRTVLLAEDDDAVREFVRAVLEQAGYAVVAAADGRAAGDLFAAAPDRFDLVLSDVVMPHAVGPELAARARGSARASRCCSCRPSPAGWPAPPRAAPGRRAAPREALQRERPAPGRERHPRRRARALTSWTLGPRAAYHQLRGRSRARRGASSWRPMTRPTGRTHWVRPDRS